MSVELIYRVDGGEPQTYTSELDDPQAAQQDLIMQVMEERPTEPWALEMEYTPDPDVPDLTRRWNHVHMI